MKQKLYLISSAIGLIAFTIGFAFNLVRSSDSEIISVTVPEPSVAVPSPARPKHLEPILPEIKEDKPLPDLSSAVQEFRELAHSVGSNLMSFESEHQENSDHHHAPLSLLKVGSEIARVDDAVDANPALFKESVKFYSDCATNDSLSDAVRAVCLANLRDRAKKFGYPLDKSAFSATIVRLSDNL